MYDSNRNSFKPLMLILGILSIILGIIIPKNFGASLTMISFILGAFILVEGFIKLSERSVIKNLGFGSGWLTFSAVIDIIFGVFCFITPELGVTYVWIMFSISFIVDSIFELFATKLIDRDNQKGLFWFNVILGVLSLLLGFYLLFSPMLAASTLLFIISFYLVFFGILQIIKSL
ncbi:DUF308 domain-containing protein [Lactobacillus sp. S2-2]|uniref:DUF308 domain-containing protein n=1 Tax=Lactobacillus sp. S2-2 TaxID=2692917 RepID=UPI001F3BFA86|nr:DUF308 domain-containing protein [Lactobacillus sp. S2-2]MCF6515242.1 DUF308 domain-containing protein [Lactobacillus sp. S2-2]